jgi:hypothetical protein
MKSVVIAGLAFAALVAFAPPALADDDLYLEVISGSLYYKKYGADALLQEGYKVCEAVSQGYDFSDVISMIQSDLPVSSSAAGEIYGAATAGLGC